MAINSLKDFKEKLYAIHKFTKDMYDYIENVVEEREKLFNGIQEDLIALSDENDLLKKEINDLNSK